MIHPFDSLATLIGSRICHDMVSPVGAVGNGVELLQLSGAAPSMELTLISESATHAAIKLKQFRLAFGMATDGMQISGAELGHLIQQAMGGGSIEIIFSGPGNYARNIGQMVMLGAMCAERALAFGGQIKLEESNGNWNITGHCDRMKADPAVWALLNGNTPVTDLAPADVQFALLPRLAASAGRTCRHALSGTSISLAF